MAELLDSVQDAAPRLHVSHERLPDADTADATKAYWRAARSEFKALRE